MPSNPSEGSAQGEGAPGSSGSELAIVPVQAEGSAAPQGGHPAASHILCSLTFSIPSSLTLKQLQARGERTFLSF